MLVTGVRATPTGSMPWGQSRRAVPVICQGHRQAPAGRLPVLGPRKTGQPAQNQADSLVLRRHRYPVMTFAPLTGTGPPGRHAAGGKRNPAQLFAPSLPAPVNGRTDHRLRRVLGRRGLALSRSGQIQSPWGMLPDPYPPCTRLWKRNAGLRHQSRVNLSAHHQHHRLPTFQTCLRLSNSDLVELAGFEPASVSALPYQVTSVPPPPVAWSNPAPAVLRPPFG